MDLAIAATANAHGVPLLTRNGRDFQIIKDLTDARDPSASDESATGREQSPGDAG